MSTSITFKNYPMSNRVPGVFTEFDNSKANTSLQQMRALIIGQMTAAGTEVAGTPSISGGVGDAQSKYGINSMLAQMVEMYRLNDTFGEVWCLPLADGAGTAASGTITVTGAATAAGTIPLYIGASPINPVIEVPVASGDAATAIATNIAAAINAIPTAPVTASAAVGVVTITAVHKGLLGNGIDMRACYRGAAAGETIPAGIALAFAGTAAGTGTLLAGGTANPTISSALANLAGDTTFDFIITPYTDPTNTAAMTAFLSDATGRWSWQQQLYGGAWSFERGTLSTLAAFGATLNDQHTFIPGLYDSPTPDYLLAVDIASACIPFIRANPAIPLQYIPLQSYAPPIQSRFMLSERNTLLYDGIASVKVTDAGTLEVERMITTYQKNAAGAVDNSYLDVETMYCLQYMARDLVDYLKTQFPQAILVADGTPIGFGSNMVTSQTIRGAMNARYNTYCTAGVAQNSTQFAQQSEAVNNGNGTVSLLAPFMVADQLRMIPILVQFSKP